MIASGTTIERIVRGWRSLWASETGATSDSSMVGIGSRMSGTLRPWASSSAGVDSMDPDPTGRVLVLRHRTMVLSVGRVTHGRDSGGRAGRPLGWTRPLPRTRWTTFETGVRRRAKYVARPGTSSPLASAARRPSGVDGSPSSAE